MTKNQIYSICVLYCHKYACEIKEMCSLVWSSMVGACLNSICTWMCYISAQLLYLHVQVGI